MISTTFKITVFFLTLIFLGIFAPPVRALDCANPQDASERGQCLGQTLGSSTFTSAESMSDASATASFPAYGTSGCTSTGCDSSVTQTQYYDTGSSGSNSSQLEADGTAAMSTTEAFTNGTVDASCKSSTDFYNGTVNTCNQSNTRTFTTNDPIMTTSQNVVQNSSSATSSCTTYQYCAQWTNDVDTYTCQKSAVESTTGTCSIITTGNLASSSVSASGPTTECVDHFLYAQIKTVDANTYTLTVMDTDGTDVQHTNCDTGAVNPLDSKNWHVLATFTLQPAAGQAADSPSGYVRAYGTGCNDSGNVNILAFDSSVLITTCGTTGEQTPTIEYAISINRSDYTESSTDTCVDTAYEPASAVCTDLGSDGLGNKTFSDSYNSLTINHACWAMEYDNIVQNTSYTNTCSTIEATEGCSNTGSSCLSYSGTNCTLWELTWECYNGSTTCSFYTTQETCVTCPLDANGNPDCMAATGTYAYDESANLSTTTTYLAMLDELEGDFNCSSDTSASSSTCDTVTTSSGSCSIELFPGANYTCRNQVTGYMKCCKAGGALGGAIDSCNDTEKALFDIRDQDKGPCHYVGEYCASRFAGVCIEKKKSYCCFSSKLSRILQEQGRAQLGTDWGSASSPDCTGFDMCEFQSLDFSQIDLSEYFGDIVTSFTIPTISEVTSGSWQ